MPRITDPEFVRKVLSLRADMRAIFITTFAGEIETSSGIPPKSLEEDLLRKPVKTTEMCAAVQKMSVVH